MIILYILLFLLTFFFLYLWYVSRGVTTPIIGANSIATIKKYTIGGIEQYATIRGVDKSNPVLLYLHGGPGMPEVALAKEYSTFLEENFVVVHWEQRGAGKTYALYGDKGVNLKQIISDTKEISLLLAKEFKQEKIHLLGHSWGSFLGMLTLHKYPELFHNYIGIGQVCNQYKAEEISLAWIKEQALKSGKKRVIKRAESFQLPAKDGPIESWLKIMSKERAFVVYFGGIIYGKNSSIKILKDLLFASEYTLSEKFKLFKGSLTSFKAFWLDVIAMDFCQMIQKVEIPIYILQGKYDYATATSVSKEFFDQLEAPKKKFILFEHSAHSPHFEEEEKFNLFLKEEILK